MEGEVLRGFPKTVQTALREGNTTYVKKLFGEEKNFEDIKNNSWDLIPVITEHLVDENRCNNGELYKCCVKLLKTIAENSNAEEALLQFISEIEEAKEDSKFIILLNPLYMVINRISTKKINSLAWSFNAIQTYLVKLDTPNYENLEGKERLLLDNSEPVAKITRLYQEVLVFYNKFLSLISKDTDKEVRSVLSKFLVQLLGNPLCYLSMEDFDGIKTDSRTIAEEIVKNILKTMSDPFVLTEMRFNEKNDEIVKPDTLSIATLFYLLYCENVYFDIVPKVYNPIYIFETSLYLLCSLLEQNNLILLEKAIGFASSVFLPLEGHNISYMVLHCEDHRKFCMLLANVIVYNSSNSVRKSALGVLNSYLNAFEVKAVYLIISNLLGILSHSGLIGYLITYYKELLSREFKEAEIISEYFKGSKLLSILRKFCYLPEKEKSDLMENSDRIISSLNLLRFLILRDKNNITKIQDFFAVLETMYFEPLRKGIELSKAHYELEIKNIKEEKADFQKNQDNINVSVTVNQIDLPKMDKEEKIKVLCSSLTAFDIIHSLLSRVNTCSLWIAYRQNFSQSTTESPNNKYESEIRNKILAASLPYVLELGWSKECLSKGAEKVGYPGITHGMFTGGAGDLVHYFNTSSNLKLVEILKQLQKDFEEKPISPGQFVELAIQERLKILVPYISRWPQAIAIMSLPPNVPNALAALLTMVDDICYYAGDRSVDFNWYVRRLGVAGVYKATELYLMQDKSIEQKDTWEFLERRMQEAVQLHDIISKSELASQGAKDVAKSAFVTARNILGLNWNR